MKKLSLLLMITLALASCSRKEDAEPKEEEGVIVSSIVVDAQPFTRTLHLVGEVKAAEHVALFSKVNGKLASYTVQKGAYVEKGQEIASVDRDEVGYTFKQAPITSPLTGIVAALPLDIGSEIAPQLPIGFVMNIDEVLVTFDLPERYRRALSAGQEVNVVVDGIAFDAKVETVDPLINPLTHTFTIEARLNNREHALLPGMFATGELVLERFEEGILLPEEAVTAIEGEWFLYKMEEERAVLQKISLGLRKEGCVQIVDGVSPGDRVIVGGNHKVSDGQKVTIQ